jgi:hypothetical protein
MTADASQSQQRNTTICPEAHEMGDDGLQSGHCDDVIVPGRTTWRLEMKRARATVLPCPVSTRLDPPVFSLPRLYSSWSGAS